MVAEWTTRTVSDLVSNGVLFVEDGNHGEYRPLAHEFESVGTPFIRPDDLKDGAVDFLHTDRINDTALARVRKGKGRAGDIVFTHRATVGRIARVGPDAPAFVANPGVTVWRTTDKETVDPHYLYFFMQTPAFMDQVWAEAGNTDTFPYVSLTQQRKLKISFPCIDEQRRIGQILGALDDKIELNRRMNATLEAMARALFQSWFVDFDPVRAKLDGRKPTGMGDATAALFPDSFQDSEIGHIPKGWDLRSLDRVADYLNGLALQKFPPEGGPTLPVIKIAQLRKGDTTGADRCNTKLPPSYVIRDGDVLFSWSGSLEVELWCGGVGALNQHLFKVTSSEFPKWFYYLWTLYHLDEFRLIAADKATTMGHIQRGHLTAAKVLIPPPELLDDLTRTMSPMIEQLIAKRIQSRTLDTVRDALLPKLLSGALQVLQAETADNNVLSLVSVEPTKPLKKASDEFIEAIVIAQLVRRLATAKHPLGRKRYNKLAYLAHRKAEDDVTQHYLKKAAGPYSPWAKYGGPENIAQKNGYVQRVKVGVYEGLVAGPNVDKIDSYLSHHPVCGAVDWVISKFRLLKNDDLELLATVDFASLDLAREKQAVTLDNIKHVIATNKDWAPKLDRQVFSDVSITGALLKLMQLFPASHEK